MAVDLPQKAAHLIRDFRAVQKLVEFIEHELEKRIVARLGLVKIESLSSLIGAYKNEIKRKIGNTKELQQLECLIAQLNNDVSSGVREARNAQVGHCLGLKIE